MKKILIFSNEFPPVIGGAGIVAYEIAFGLSKIGYNVTVLTCKNKHRKIQMNFNILEVKILPKVFPLNYLHFFKKVDFNKFDTIIINESGAALTASYFFDDALLKKSILLLHGSEPEEIFLHPKLLFQLVNFKKYYTNLLNKVKLIISVSDFMKEKFLFRTNLFQFESKITSWYVGINKEKFYHDPMNLHNQLGIARKEILLLSVGRISKLKGYPEKYKIFKNLIKKDLSFHWIIIGEGKYLSELKKMIIKDNLQKNISLLGKINHNELRRYYSSVDVFWLLSNYEESFGLVYLEATACGTSVIARNNAGAKEAIKHNVTGFLVKNDKEVESILENKLHKKIKKDDISQFIQKFYIQNTIKELNKLL